MTDSESMESPSPSAPDNYPQDMMGESGPSHNNQSISEETSVDINTQEDHYDFDLNQTAADQIIHKEYSNSFGVKFQVGDVMAVGITRKTHDLVQIKEILETVGKVSAMYIEKRRDRSLGPFTNTYREPISLMFNHLIYRCTRKDYLSMEEETEIKDKLADIFD